MKEEEKKSRAERKRINSSDGERDVADKFGFDGQLGTCPQVIITLLLLASGFLKCPPNRDDHSCLHTVTEYE